MDDDAAPEPELAALPAGTPIRVYEWVIPPLLLVALAAVEVWAATSADSHGAPLFSAFAVSICLVAGGALGVVAYRAYSELSAKTTEQYLTVGMVALFVSGALLSLGYYGSILLMQAGRIVADRRWRPSGCCARSCRDAAGGALRFPTNAATTALSGPGVFRTRHCEAKDHA